MKLIALIGAPKQFVAPKRTILIVLKLIEP